MTLDKLAQQLPDMPLADVRAFLDAVVACYEEAGSLETAIHWVLAKQTRLAHEALHGPLKADIQQAFERQTAAEA